MLVEKKQKFDVKKLNFVVKIRCKKFGVKNKV
mgnify:CR=1 FL=1